MCLFVFLLISVCLCLSLSVCFSALPGLCLSSSLSHSLSVSPCYLHVSASLCTPTATQLGTPGGLGRTSTKAGGQTTWNPGISCSAPPSPANPSNLTLLTCPLLPSPFVFTCEVPPVHSMPSLARFPVPSLVTRHKPPNTDCSSLGPAWASPPPPTSHLLLLACLYPPPSPTQETGDIGDINHVLR